MFHSFLTALRSASIRLYLWLRIRMIARMGLSSDQYQELVQGYISDRRKGKEMLQGALVIDRFAKLPPHERTAAAIGFGLSLITGTLGHELMTTGDPNCERGSLELIRAMTSVVGKDGNGPLAPVLGSAVRTMELMTLVRCAAISAALIADGEEKTPHSFLQFCGESMAPAEEFYGVRDAYKDSESAHQRSKAEGGTVSKQQAEELEKLFGLGSDEEQ